MADVTKILTEQVNTTNEIKSRVNLNGEAFKTFKYGTENVYPKCQATVIQTRNIGGEGLIWGNETFGVWNSYEWTGIAQTTFILGNAGAALLGLSTLGDNLSEWEVLRVVPNSGNFEEDFVTTYFVSTSDTTATISGGVVTF